MGYYLSWLLSRMSSCETGTTTITTVIWELRGKALKMYLGIKTAEIYIRKLIGVYIFEIYLIHPNHLITPISFQLLFSCSTAGQFLHFYSIHSLDILSFICCCLFNSPYSICVSPCLKLFSWAYWLLVNLFRAFNLALRLVISRKNMW